MTDKHQGTRQESMPEISTELEKRVCKKRARKKGTEYTGIGPGGNEGL